MANEPNGKKRELKFPVLCHYKIVTEDAPGMADRLKSVLHDFGIQRPLDSGHRSAQGHYLTFNVDVVVNSKEFMDKLDTAFRAVPGVKYIL